MIIGQSGAKTKKSKTKGDQAMVSKCKFYLTVEAYIIAFSCAL